MISPKLYSQKAKGDFNPPLQHHNLHEKKQQRPLNRVQEENDRVLLPLQNCIRMQSRWSRFDRGAKKTYPAALIADAQFNCHFHDVFDRISGKSSKTKKARLHGLFVGFWVALNLAAGLALLDLRHWPAPASLLTLAAGFVRQLAHPWN